MGSFKDIKKICPNEDDLSRKIESTDLERWYNSSEIVPREIFFAKVDGIEYPFYNNFPAMMCQVNSVYFNPVFQRLCPSLTIIRDEAESECHDIISFLRGFYQGRTGINNSEPPEFIQHLLYRVYVDCAKRFLGTMYAPDNSAFFAGGA